MLVFLRLPLVYFSLLKTRFHYAHHYMKDVLIRQHHRTTISCFHNKDPGFVLFVLVYMSYAVKEAPSHNALVCYCCIVLYTMAVMCLCCQSNNKAAFYSHRMASRCRILQHTLNSKLEISIGTKYHQLHKRSWHISCSATSYRAFSPSQLSQALSTKLAEMTRVSV